MEKYLLLKKSGEVEVKTAEGRLKLDTMYEWIGCQVIDMKQCPVEAKFGKLCLVFDDTFLMTNEKPEANKLASLFYGYSCFHNECLCGNVILAKEQETEDDINLVGFKDEEISMIMDCISAFKIACESIEFKVQEPRFEFISF